MSRRLNLVSAVLALVVIAGLIPVGLTLAGQQDSETARAAAEQFLTWLGHERPSWATGNLAGTQPLADIEGNTIAYLFTIERDGHPQGTAVVGNGLYSYNVLEMASSPPPSMPEAAELQTIVQKDLGTSDIQDIGPLLYLSYLGPGRLFAVYAVNGELVGVDLVQRQARFLKELTTSLVSPQEYVASKTATVGTENQAMDEVTSYRELYMPIRYMGWDHSPTPTPVGTSIPVEWRNNNCGPTSGSMVDEFYKQARGYALFDDWAEDHNRLYVLMHTNEPPFNGTLPTWAREGFVAYAQESGYGVDFNNTDWWWTDDVFFDSFPVIKERVDSHDALMILFTWVPARPPGENDPADWHYYAIRGYWDGPSLPDFIITNNPWDYEVWLNWTAYWPHTALVAMKAEGPLEMRGTTTLQGSERPPAGRMVPITVKLFTPGTFTWANRNNPAYRYELATSDTGNKTPERRWLVDFRSFENMPAGQWDVTIESPHTLMNIYHNVTLASPYTNVDMGILREGNANDDQLVNSLDFSILAASYLKGNGQPGFDSRADFNRTGVVTVLDFSILATNYLKSSPINVTPTDSPGAGMSGDGLLTLGSADLTLQPSTQNVSVDDTFNVTVQAATGTQKVNGIDAFVDFDPTYLEVVSVTNGTALPIENCNLYDNDAGTIDFSNGKTGTSLPSGTFTVVTIQFRAIAQTAGTSLTFVQTQYRNTETAYQGDSVLGNLTGATVVIEP